MYSDVHSRRCRTDPRLVHFNQAYITRYLREFAALQGCSERNRSSVPAMVKGELGILPPTVYCAMSGSIGADPD